MPWRATGDARREALANAEEAARYFGASIDFSRVRVRIGRFPLRSSLCLHGEIFIGRGIEVPPVRLLVHEFGHVWEWQHGQWQVSLGAVEQARHFLGMDVYDYGGAESVHAAVREGRRLESFNREQQAEIFAHDWACRSAGRDDGFARDLAALTAPALAAPPWTR